MVRTVVNVDGMMCGMCESHINDAIRQAMQVKKVTSSHSKGETEILSEDALDEAAVRAAIEKTGYTVKGIRSEPYEKKGFSLFHRKYGAGISYGAVKKACHCKSVTTTF